MDTLHSHTNHQDGQKDKPLLEIHELTKHFPIQHNLFGKSAFVHAADQVTLEVYRGETLGLVGESGSGKTTIGRCTLRLIEPSSGEIYLDGENILNLNGRELRRRRRKMQMVFQDPSDSLNPRFTCWQTMKDALAHAGVRGSKVQLQAAIDLLVQVGLQASDLEKYPHQFSGGQQQRIAIARALAFTPELLILDEPTASLDVSVKTQVTQLLRDLQKKYQLSYILISHDLSNVKHVADRVAVMYLGQIVELGRTSDVFEHPLHPYTKILIESVPIPDPTIIRQRIELRGEIPSASNPPAGCRFHTRCPLKMEICSQEEPHFVKKNDHQQIACFL